jgi:electron transport complex protein RnfE
MSNKHSNWFEFVKGIAKENPVFIAALGLCPTLAVTTQTINGLAMGVAVIFVLFFANMFVSLLRKFIPSTVRIPAYIMIIASFVTLVSLFLQAFAPDINRALGIFIPLIVVNCVILGRAEAFASKNTVSKSLVDALGMGIGFTLALTLIGLIRELSGSATITLQFAGLGKIFNFGQPILDDPNIVNVTTLIQNPAVVMIMPPGGFLVMGILLGIFQNSQNRKAEREKKRKQELAKAAKAKANTQS